MLEIINLLLAFSQQIGYVGIVLLMTIESSFIPFPSEIVIPPAAFLAQQGQMNIILVILAGIIGSLIGATINYFLAFSLGRKMIYFLANKKIAKMLLINEKKLQYAEKYFLRYGNFSTFLGRLIPAVRQLISIPAGLSRMNFKKFILYTALGSGLWTIVLAILGYAFGANQELLGHYYSKISLFFVLVGGVLLIILIYNQRKRRFKNF